MAGKNMVAWENVCTPIEHGGLGIKRIEDQNIFLLLKFVHNMHTKTENPCVQWILKAHYPNNKRLGDKEPMDLEGSLSQLFSDHCVSDQSFVSEERLDNLYF